MIGSGVSRSAEKIRDAVSVGKSQPVTEEMGARHGILNDDLMEVDESFSPTRGHGSGTFTHYRSVAAEYGPKKTCPLLSQPGSQPSVTRLVRSCIRTWRSTCNSCCEKDLLVWTRRYYASCVRTNPKETEAT